VGIITVIRLKRAGASGTLPVCFSLVSREKQQIKIRNQQLSPQTLQAK
jgi:hypothetical protein